jgi:2-amino-4-hydroxy-6-hydroxymethyldihydropteridine diphosphokinase
MKQTHRLYLGIGSNIKREHHIKLAISELKNHFGHLILSPVYESVAVGFSGDNFYNLVVYLESNLSFSETETILKKIEDLSGRDRSQAKFSARTLDIDLLLFDNQVLHHQGINIPRDEILKYAFVLKPLNDIAAEFIHPETQKSIAEHWDLFKQSSKQQSDIKTVSINF